MQKRNFVLMQKRIANSNTMKLNNQNTMRKTLLLFFVALTAITASAKSVVFTLNDTHKTKVFFKLGGEQNPKLVVGEDGTFTVNGLPYTFSNLLNFYISTTDYAGDRYTEDGDAQTPIEPVINIDGGLLGMNQSGKAIKVYTIDGKLIRQTLPGEKLQLDALPRGTYVITNGTSTLKMQK